MKFEIRNSKVENKFEIQNPKQIRMKSEIRHKSKLEIQTKSEIQNKSKILRVPIARRLGFLRFLALTHGCTRYSFFGGRFFRMRTMI